MKNSVKMRFLSGICYALPRMAFITLFSLLSTIAFAEELSVKGTVVDDKGESVIGASVLVKGTTNGTITDIDGAFTLNHVPSNGTLQVSYVGYVSKNVPVQGKKSFKIVLEEDHLNLEEVVVVGYGTMKKSDLTGAMSRVTSKQIEERPVQNALQAIQGKAAGVDITTNNRPGELGDIRIRGNRSLNATNDPLYVIDGIPLTAGSMSDINPSDIESMEILKDASATAIYGSRGANGVILITTKKGKTGKTTMNYDGSISLSHLYSTTDYMKAGELLDYKRMSAINGGTYNGAYGTAPDPDRDRALWLGQQGYMDRVVQSAYGYNADGSIQLRAATAEEIAMGYADQVPVYNSANMLNTEWGDLVTRNGFTQNHQISLSSGTDKSRLYMSFGYLDQQAVMKDQDFERFTANINGEIKPAKWLTVGMALNASHSIKNYGIVSNFANTVAKDSYGLAMNTMPWTPAYDADGSILIADTGDAEHNVLRNIDAGKNEYRYYGVNYSSFAEVQFLPWLKYRFNFGSQYRNSRQGSFFNEDWTNPYGFASTAPLVGYNSQSQVMSWTLENLLYVNKTFNKIHTLNATLMQSAEKRRSESINIRAYDVVYPTSMWYDLGSSAKEKAAFGTGYSTWSRASYMGRVNYSLMDRYLITVTGRFDGASMLAKGHKWDFFPSTAVAWKINEEEFLRDQTWIDQLKLRFGYGQIGNSSVSPYSTAGSATSVYANIPFGEGNTTNTTGTKTNVMPNLFLGWEKTSTFNYGVDFSVLNSRISGSVEYYQSKTSDLLMNRAIPIITGYAQLQDNVGKTENKGIEVTLSSRNIVTRDFTWTTDFSFGLNKEKITELADGKKYDSTGPWYVGQPLNIFYDYKYDRIWQNDDDDQRLMALYAANGLTFLPGQYKICDQKLIVDNNKKGESGWITKTVEINGEKQEITYQDNGFGKFNDDDKVIYNKSPKWTGGMTNTFEYKNFILSIFAYFRFGNTYYGLTQTIGRRVENDIWSPTNTNAKFAQPTTATRTGTYDYVRNYTKGSMGIIRNISLSYNFQPNLLKKIGLSSAQVYGQVINPFVFGGELVKAGINPDDITGWDNSSHIGGQTNNTALVRSYVFGLRFGF